MPKTHSAFGSKSAVLTLDRRQRTMLCDRISNVAAVYVQFRITLRFVVKQLSILVVSNIGLEDYLLGFGPKVCVCYTLVLICHEDTPREVGAGSL